MPTYPPVSTGGAQFGTLAARPAAPPNGTIYVVTAGAGLGIAYVYTGTWQQIAQGPQANPLALSSSATTLSPVIQVPSDGNRHLIVVTGFVNVSSAETGGALTLAYTSGGSGETASLDVGGHGTGVFEFTPAIVQVDGGTTAQINQAALTVGSAQASFTTSAF